MSIKYGLYAKASSENGGSSLTYKSDTSGRSRWVGGPIIRLPTQSSSTLQAMGLKDLGPAVLPARAKGQIKAFLLLLRNARQVATGGHEEVETERQWSQRSDNAGQQLRRNAFSACY